MGSFVAIHCLNFPAQQVNAEAWCTDSQRHTSCGNWLSWSPYL